MIITYQLCKVSKKNVITAYHQQIAMLQQAGRSITPRNAFVQDLLTWMENDHQKGGIFILGGDFNEVKNTDHQGMYIDFDTEMLFGNGDIKLANEKLKTVNSRGPYLVKE
eukprot:1958680-Ditylum_brightwellii.AAC.1